MLTHLHPGIQLTLVLAVPTLVALWGKHTFVHKRECEHSQSKCVTAICGKVDDIKKGQESMVLYVQRTERTLGRIEQYIADAERGK